MPFRLLSYRIFGLGSTREFGIGVMLFFSFSFLSYGSCASSLELSKLHTIEAVLNTTMPSKRKTKQSLMDKERDNL